MLVLNKTSESASYLPLHPIEEYHSLHVEELMYYTKSLAQFADSGVLVCLEYHSYDIF